jgi:hypothetical protein
MRCVLPALLALLAGCPDTGTLGKPTTPGDVDGTHDTDTGPYNEDLPGWPGGPGQPGTPDTDEFPNLDSDTGTPDRDSWSWHDTGTPDLPGDDTDVVPGDSDPPGKDSDVPGVDTDTVPGGGGDTDVPPGGSDTDTDVPPGGGDTDTVPGGGGDTDTVPGGGDTDTVPGGGGDTDTVPGGGGGDTDTVPGWDTADTWTVPDTGHDTDTTIGPWICVRAQQIQGFLDRFQTPGDRKVIFCHRAATGKWVVIDASISSCISHAKSHLIDEFPSTLCDS